MKKPKIMIIRNLHPIALGDYPWLPSLKTHLLFPPTTLA